MGHSTQIDQAETLTIFFSGEYVMDVRKKWPTPFNQIFSKISLTVESNHVNCNTKFSWKSRIQKLSHLSEQFFIQINIWPSFS